MCCVSKFSILAYLLEAGSISAQLNKFIRNAMPSTRSCHKVSFRKTAALHLLTILEDKWVRVRRPCAVYHSSQHPGVTWYIYIYIYVAPHERIARAISLSRNEMNTLCVPQSRELNFHRSRGNAYDGRHGLCIALARPRVPLFPPDVIKCARIRWNP